MSARDIFHNLVRLALQKDGWTITHDPLSIDLADGQLQIDLGAERLIAAQKQDEQIAVEIKSFVAPSAISEFHTALAQCLNYRVALKLKEPERILYLAVPLATYEDFFSRQLPQLSIHEYHLKLLVFDPENEVIVKWIN
ncbi:MAG: XisH family protein [Nostoc sp. DedVER02]|uniref:XisH family protein n=1 Tax=unclassified Nostoc TaxID=2593658 RepID=UPI002AD3F6C9|nr:MULTISPECIES: XisH family protein [unclassified Nostoc]MDZ7988198.1 XisH family protein [Nostoc sp. DedVER02]MDZ8113494.1 XisH family protein [Nostoc sp. DedVER01b]